MLTSFPGALGWGRFSYGGSGRHLAVPTSQRIHVTNLNAGGPGSLEAAVQASGPRTVIFDVSGVINLSRQLAIKNPYITIAGETAPSPGILLRNANVMIRTHNVIMRHLRIRPAHETDHNIDAVTIRAFSGGTTHNVIVDHCSFAWTSDETFASGPTVGSSLDKVTWSNILAAEPLDFPGGHPYGPSLGGTIGAITGRISMIRTLTAHCTERNPRCGVSSTAVELVNNVAYNWRSDQTCNIKNEGEGGVSGGLVLNIDMIGCYYKPGAISSSTSYAMKSGGGINDDTKVYVSGVICPRRPADTGDEWDAINPDIPESPHRSMTRVCDSGDGHTPMGPTEAYEHVLANAGARPLDRDATDLRFIAEVGNGTGRAAPKSVPGGYPSLAVNVINHTDIPADPDEVMPSGYTALEEWLHAKHNALVPGGVVVEPPETPSEEGYSIRVQHFAKVFGASSDTDSVAITEVGGANKAFVWLSSSPWAQPDSNSVAELNNDDLGVLAYIDPSDLDAVQFERLSSGDNIDMRVWGSVIEYVGEADGPNEFIVRYHDEVTLTAGTASVHQPVSGINNYDRCIAIISGVVNEETTDLAQDMTLTAEVTNDPNDGVLLVKNTSYATTRLILTVVEFTGTNWSVQNNLKQEHITTSGEPTEHTIDPVPSWDNALIFPSFRAGHQSNDELSIHIYPGEGTNKLNFEMDDDASGANRFGVAHLVGHPDLRVRRYGSIGGDITPPGVASGSNSLDVDITAVEDLAQSLTILTSDNTASSNRYPRQFFAHRFKSGTSKTQVELWRGQTGTSSNFNLQVIEFLMKEVGYENTVPIIRRRRRRRK